VTAPKGEERGGAVKVVVRWIGHLCSLAALGAWSVWIGWRVATLSSPVGVFVLLLELAAIAAAATLTLGLWSSRPASGPRRSGTLVPARLAGPLGVCLADVHPVGQDDTVEVAFARRGVALLRGGSSRPTVRSSAWAVLATEGMRRMLFVVALVAVLLSGRFPFPWPPAPVLAALAVSQPLLAVGHWSLSGGLLRPGDRLAWSMGSIGAGFGDGNSRSGLPIRWAATIATVVVLNVAVSLRGVSDRWTHGLGSMGHDERVVSMIVATWLVVTGLVALRSLPHPVLAPYGATRRLEEGPARRLALGATFAVAGLGLAAGMLPGVSPA